MLICRTDNYWDGQGIAIHCNMCFRACYPFESVIFYAVSPFLAGMLEESIDILCRFNFPDLCADLIAPDRISFQILFCCHACSLRCAVDFEPYLFGISFHLHPVIRTNMIPLIVILSLLLGLPVLAGFGRCDSIMSHCESVNSWNCMNWFVEQW